MALQELCHSCNLLHHSVRVVVKEFLLGVSISGRSFFLLC